MKLLREGEWYTRVASSALYEHDFERIVAQQASSLFPGYHYADFKITVSSDTESAKPDAAIVASNYSGWWVIEIEMANHSFASHVFPQVRTFANGYYDRSHAEWLAEHNQALDRARLRDLVRGRPPGVLVVVDEDCPDWASDLARYSISLAVLEIYRSPQNRTIFRVTGDYPRVSSSVLTLCRPDPALPGCLVVDSPAALNVAHGERVFVSYHGSLTEWIRVDASNRVWLMPASASPLKNSQRYHIVGLDDGALEFRETRNRGNQE